MPSSVLNSDDGVISGTSGIKTTGGDDGNLNIQSNGTTVAAVSNGAFQIGGNNISADNSLGFRNRIINGDMRIDQRNAGASVSIPAGTSPRFAVDRNGVFNQSDAGEVTAQQDSSAPSGFSNSLKVTVTTADATVAATDRAGLVQNIEGFNFADAMFGTASAKTVTLSFWVRSSLTGTFGGNLNNNGSTRSYIFNYTISSADTWEYKTIVIPGDTSGTWVGATNGKGVGIIFSLMAGTTFQGTVNTWNAANVHNTSGSVNVLGTLNATWYITGVQLEVGSVATPFERLDYGRQLSQCQRYYYKVTADQQFRWLAPFGQVGNANAAVVGTPFPVPMRIRPTALEQSGTASDYLMSQSSTATVACTSVPAFNTSTNQTFGGSVFTSTSLSGTAGHSTAGLADNSTAFLAWSAEL